MAFDLGGSEVIIVVLIALVLFGGSRLAGLGKSAGRAIREFKDETSGLSEQEDGKPTPAEQTAAKQSPAKQAPAKQAPAKQAPAEPPTSAKTEPGG
jgi:sec-independent protein translocase protein TatA